jgi:co-chaperonin GroES (HSP10)
MKVRPAASMKIVIHPIDHAPMSKGGLILTAEAQRKRKINQGIVISKGSLVSDDIQIADHVLFNAYSGDKIVLASGGEYIVLYEYHIVAKLEDSDVVLLDSISMLRILAERKFELMQKYAGDVKSTALVREVCENLEDRVRGISLAEGFEF